MLTKSLTSIKEALIEKTSSIFINNEEVQLSPSTMVFSLSHENSFNPLPGDLKKLFRVVSYNSPDTLKLLEIGLVECGILLTQTITPKIRSFFSLLTNMFEGFSAGFGEKKIAEFLQCVQENFKDILKWKDGLKIAKELSTVTEIPDVLNQESSNFDGIDPVDTPDNVCKHFGSIRKSGFH